MSFLNSFMDPVLGNIIGGTAAQAITMGSLFLLTILVVLLLASRIDLELALIIISPAVIAASFAGLLPPLAFGVIVLLLGIFFAAIIMALAR